MKSEPDDGGSSARGDQPQCPGPDTVLYLPRLAAGPSWRSLSKASTSSMASISTTAAGPARRESGAALRLAYDMDLLVNSKLGQE